MFVRFQLAIELKLKIVAQLEDKEQTKPAHVGANQTNEERDIGWLDTGAKNQHNTLIHKYTFIG